MYRLISLKYEQHTVRQLQMLSFTTHVIVLIYFRLKLHFTGFQ